MTNLYVIGKYNDSKNISERIKELENMGYTITHNWTKIKEETKDSNLKNLGNDEKSNINFFKDDYALPLQENAIDEINGVRNADIVIAYMNDPNYTYRGTFTEIGCAIGSNVPVLVYNSYKRARCMTNCFYWYPTIKHFTNWEELINSLP